MRVIEFETQFKDGVLKIPKKYSAFKNAKVKVSLLSEVTVPKSNYFALQQILNTVSPNELFKEIENPVDWQKNVRDEWE